MSALGQVFARRDMYRIHSIQIADVGRPCTMSLRLHGNLTSLACRCGLHPRQNPCVCGMCPQARLWVYCLPYCPQHCTAAVECPLGSHRMDE